MKNSLVAALVATTVALAAIPGAQARDGISPGGAAALGVLGGLAIGGAIASSQNEGGYYPGRPVYRAPRPVYVEEEVCHMERRGYVDAYGYEHVRRVRVCE